MKTHLTVALLFAATLFASAATAQTKSLDALLREAAMHEAKGNTMIARDLYAKAVVEFQYNAAFLHIGNIHLGQHESLLALASFEKFLQLNPTAPERVRVQRWVRLLRRCEKRKCNLLFVRTDLDGADVFLDRDHLREADQAGSGRSLGRTPLLTEVPGSFSPKTEVTVTAKTKHNSWMTWREIDDDGILIATFPRDDVLKRLAKRRKDQETRAKARPIPVVDSLDAPSGVAKSGKNDVALLIGVEDYAFLPDVPGAARNLADWERFLQDDLGVPTVLTLRNQDATREEILSFATLAAKRARNGGRLWFVYIGHGAPALDGNDGLLVGVDGQQTPKRLAARGVKQQELLAALQAGDQSETIVVLDACFSGRDRTGNALASGTMPVFKVDEKVKGRKQSTVILTAARSNEVAGDIPALKRPAFSYLLLGAMRGWADDGDARVTTGEVLKFARREIAAIPGRQQTPQLTGSASIVLTDGAKKRRHTTSNTPRPSTTPKRKKRSDPESKDAPTKFDSGRKRGGVIPIYD